MLDLHNKGWICKLSSHRKNSTCLQSTLSDNVSLFSKTIAMTFTWVPEGKYYTPPSIFEFPNNRREKQIFIKPNSPVEKRGWPIIASDVSPEYVHKESEILHLVWMWSGFLCEQLTWPLSGSCWCVESRGFWHSCRYPPRLHIPPCPAWHPARCSSRCGLPPHWQTKKSFP